MPAEAWPLRWILSAMPRFFFSVAEHRQTADRSGIVLPDLIAAKREAIIHAGTMMQDNPDLLGLSDALRVQIHDEAGQCLAILAVQMMDVVDFD